MPNPHRRHSLRLAGFARFLLAGTGLVCVGGAACVNAAQSMLGILPGVVNDPSNLSLRRAILGFGLSEFCHQMTTHNAPLKLSDDTPVIGRFYPTACQQQSLPNGDLFVQFSGFGYAFTNLSKKASFTMGGGVEYSEDFQLSGSTMYVYFNTRRVASSDFRIHVVEQPVAAFLNGMSTLGNTLGGQLVTGKLQDGFTVVRASNGDVDFGLGVISPGTRPVHPFDVHGSGRVTYENLRTEVHQNQRDFIGPIEVTDSGRALYVTAQVDGVSAIDLLVMRRADAEASLRYYTDYAQAGPLAGVPLASEIVQMGGQYQRAVPVPAGTYYVVLDNTPSAGTVSPPMNPLDDRAALVSYAVQVGDAP